MLTEHTLVPEMLVFAKVVELRGFAAAARQLGLTTSAVSRSVGRLEAHWGWRPGWRIRASGCGLRGRNRSGWLWAGWRCC